MPSSGLYYDAAFGPGPSNLFGPKTPSSSSLEITGDIDVRCKLQATVWAPASSTEGGLTLVNKWAGGASNESWQFYRGVGAAAGDLVVGYRTSLGEATGAQSTAAVPFSDTDTGWVRFALDTNNGASGRTTTFYTSTDSTDDPDAVSWDPLGDPVTTAGSIALANTSDPVWINRGQPIIGTMYVVQILDGIEGTEVAHVNFKTDPTDDIVVDTGTFIDRNGNEWTWQNGGELLDFVKPTLVGVSI